MDLLHSVHQFLHLLVAYGDALACMVGLLAYIPRTVRSILNLVGDLADTGGEFFYGTGLFHSALA